MKQAQGRLEVRTKGRSLVDVTTNIRSWLQNQSVSKGLLTVFITHTSASLTIQENADPDVQVDMLDFMSRLVPDNSPHYLPTSEGYDDMPAHIRSSLTDVQLSIPVTDGRLSLGTWQGIYVFEHRERPHRRNLVLHLIGE